MKIIRISYIEIRKSFNKSLLILSSIYLFYIIISSLFRIVLQNALSETSIVWQKNIEQNITDIALSWGLLIFIILIIVNFGKEIQNKTISKFLVSGYSRTDIFIGVLIRNIFYSLFFLLLYGIIICVFNFPIIKSEHSNNIKYYFFFVFAVYFYSSIIAAFLILYLKKIYLSIIIMIFLVLGNQVFFLSKHFFLTDFSFLSPFAILNLVENPINTDYTIKTILLLIFYMVFFNVLISNNLLKKRFT